MEGVDLSTHFSNGVFFFCFDVTGHFDRMAAGDGITESVVEWID
jgi:hypothetical protein